MKVKGCANAPSSPAFDASKKAFSYGSVIKKTPNIHVHLKTVYFGDVVGIYELTICHATALNRLLNRIVQVPSFYQAFCQLLYVSY